MFFGATTFSQATFADIGIANALVNVSGSRVNTSIGNVVVVGNSLVLPNGNRYNLSTGAVTVKEGANAPVTGNQFNLGTLAAKIKDSESLKNENIVKVITEKSLEKDHFPKAVSFLRKSEQTDNVYHHIGIYCYSINCLEKFIQLDQSKNEIENRLEQLRALDNNIDINVSLAKSSPIGVDTKEDYLALKKIMEYKN